MFKLAILILSLSALCNYSAASSAGCVKARPVHVENSFIEGNFIVLKHSDTEVVTKADKSFDFIGKPINAKSLCWESIGTLKDGSSHKVQIKCEYSNPADLNCGVTKEDNERFLNVKGNVVVTSTDNSSYIAGVSCVTGKASIWWIASRNGSPIDAALEKSILGEFRKLGLDTSKVAVKNQSAVSISEFKIQNGDC